MADMHTEPLSFEKVWAALMEDREQMKETREQFREMSRETREQFRAMSEETREQMKETARQMKETDRKIGELGNRFGEIVEHLVAPGTMEKFNELGFNFTRIARDYEFKDPETRRSLAEVDVHLENGDVVIAVEVKAKLQTEDVKEHISRMTVLRRLADERGDTRIYRGAVATAVLTDETRAYAQKAGFYVLEQSGDTMKLDIPEGFVPRDW